LSQSVLPVLLTIRKRFHPFYYARRSPLGRSCIRLFDFPVWLSEPQVNFKIRGKLITHGLAFAATGFQEPGSEALALACMQKLDLHSFWDVGANIGHYTWLLKSASPKLEVVLFEALPENARLIDATLKRHNFEDVALVVAGASDHSGEGVFHTDSIAGATSTLEDGESTFEERHWGVQPGVLKVVLTTIDEQRLRRNRVDFMKIDVEGHEGSVLRGARQTISSDQPVLLVECGHPGQACLRPLEEEGYKIVDAEELSYELRPGSINYFAFPQRFHSSIDELFRSARALLSH
jgi:FkbM family methyltransferase